MRPSFVRSKSAPQASNSFTRAGASLACNSAIRQLFRYCPPRSVSAKCTRQLSRSSTLASAAATPPSAITVCALPSRLLQTRPTLAPAALASIAARSPAPPAPITSTSWSCSRWLAMSDDDPRVVDDAHGHQAHVDVGDADEHQRGPRPAPVEGVEPAGLLPRPHPCLAEARAVGAVHAPADQVAEGVAAEEVAAQQHGVDGEDDGAQPDPEAPAEVECLGRVVPEEGEDDERQVEEVAVEVLQDQGEEGLA